MGLPYVLNNGNLGKFLGMIVSAPVPAKVDYKYLETRGYTGKNDKYLIAFLKNLGFIDKAGNPVQRWHDHRHSQQSKAVRALAVAEAYAGFFNVYPDAPKRTESEFNNWARVEDPTASPVTIRRSWATLRTMIPLADFDEEVQGSQTNTTLPTGAARSTDLAPVAGAASATQSPQVQLGAVGGITINIELQLPASADAKFFDQFFSSMRKHLLDENG